jgi:hypothetical protein
MDFLSRLQKKQYPITFDVILEEVLDLSYPDSSDMTIIIKGGGYYSINIHDYLKYLPEMKVLFIMRDPRAIFNSQKKSINSMTGKPMQENLLRFVELFRSVSVNCSKPQLNNHIKTLMYESLINNEKRVMQEVYEYIGHSGERSATPSDYFDKIPQQQKHLHANVKGNESIVDRIDAWKQELSRSEIMAIEFLLKKELALWGYKSIYSNSLRVGTITLLLKHFFNRLFNRVRKSITTGEQR